MENKLSEYKIIPKGKGKAFVVPSFLTGDFGEDFIEEYNRRVEKDFKGNKILSVLNYSNNVVKGSNVYSIVLANRILNEVGLRTATQKDIENIFENEDLTLKRFYVDTALCLRDSKEPNRYLAESLTERLGKRKTPLMIPLSSLDLVIDQNSSSGLNFNLRSDGEIIYAEELLEQNNKKRFSKTNKSGLPIFDKNGSRTLYTRDSGLSRVFLNRNSDLYSDDGNLSGSVGGGRVVVCSGDAQKF